MSYGVDQLLEEWQRGGAHLSWTEAMDLGDALADSLAAERQRANREAALADQLAEALSHMPVAWSCSSRCWQEGGPHDDTCHEVGPQVEALAAHRAARLAPPV